MRPDPIVGDGMTAGRVSALVALVGSLLLVSCSSVDVVRLTNETFPPKASTEEVEVLEHDPACPSIRLALLQMEGSDASFQEMQEKMLKKAAKLGADAIVFHRPQEHVEHSLAYQPVYSPWGMTAYGYPGWGYGGWGMGGFGGSIATPYDYTVKSLKGVAIRYVRGKGPKC